MADLFTTEGKVKAMTGIKNSIAAVFLCDSSGNTISSISNANSSFAVNATTGQLSNTSEIVFTITSSFVGDTAALVKISDGSTTPKTLIQLDLDSNVTLSTAGEATFSAGDLSADL